MTDHNGQPTVKVLCYHGEKSLIERMVEKLQEKGFGLDDEHGTVTDKVKEITLYGCHPITHKTGGHIAVWNFCSGIGVVLTPENIDTFINNLQP